ncbi:PfaD family polyunsaturated fatty acid/polyketide biosynthesis protein [Streptomyces sp. NPDC048281]|uniref:PfaD family polyunsaturated fatty acid/polyketide biosynthesis protein n=1 Tax=Streptomyces sp. NPDC048281 TaxID=3154715 RepID=UPI003412F769
MTGVVPLSSAATRLVDVVRRIREPVHVVAGEDGAIGAISGDPVGGRVLATLPALYPEWLGDRSFGEVHGTRFPYVAGEMAHGISTTDMVVALGQADLLGFFGAGGLSLDRVGEAVETLRKALPGRANWGVNLLHAPSRPAWERGMVDLLLRSEVPAVSVSAFMELTPTVLQLAVSGLRTDAEGRIVRQVRLFPKVSRPEVAERFLAPPPWSMLEALCTAGRITYAEADLAARIPVAEDLTVEADSGGHTDNRPLVALLPRIQELAAHIAGRHGHTPARIGVAGGLGTPAAMAAAFAAGAAYVVTGSVNQTCVEAGISAGAKKMLAGADLADVMMAASGDMFELGVKVQVLRRGTLFGPRANRLHQLYTEFDSLESIPASERRKLEHTVFRAPFEEIWEETRGFWENRDPAQLARAETDPKHRMALLFRWYLGKASWWPIRGEQARGDDYQLWCGPAAGAFNSWVRGSFLADLADREVVQVARNLLEGAAVVTRAHQLRTYGVPVPAGAFAFVPRRLA